MTISDKIKGNIKHQLKIRRKTVEDLTSVLGVNRNYINQITDGTRLNKLYNISKAIGCDLHELFM